MSNTHKQKIEKLLASIEGDVVKLKDLINAEPKEGKKEPDHFSKYVILLRAKKIHLTKEPIPKSYVFKTVVEYLAPNYELNVLNHMFSDVKSFNSRALIVTENELKDFTPSISARYKKCDKKSQDGKTMYAWCAWSDWVSKEKGIPGNFPILIKKLSGMDIIVLAKK